MAISTDASRDDIYAEFGADSKPANSLLSMHNKIGLSDPYARSKFEGLGQPFGLDTEPVTNISEDSAQFHGHISDSGGIDVFMYYEYSTTSDFSSNVNSTTPTNNGTGTNIQHDNVGVTGLSPDTDYYVRLVAYNAFNDHNNDHIKTFDVESFTTDASCPEPTGLFVTSDFEGFDLDWDDMSVDSYDIEIRVNGGSWNTLVNGHTGTSYNHEGCNTWFNDGDTVDYRVRSNCGGSSSTWNEDLGNEASCF